MKTVSIKTMIAKIIRDTRLKDATYADDMLEWIPSAMGELQTSFSLQPTSQLIDIQFHKGPLPFGVEAILAVTYNGIRMQYANPDQDVSFAIPKVSPQANASIFISSNKTGENVMDLTAATTATSSYNQSTLTPVPTGPVGPYWYRDLPGAVETNLDYGVIRMHFLQVPVDEEGYPLIPDNENYKEAIYYKVRAKLIEAGYPDSILKWQDCMQLFEKYAGRALGEIRYPTTDRMEAMNKTLTRLIPPTNYYQNFSDNRSSEAYPTPRSPWLH